MEEQYIKEITKWECPEGTGVPLITMPNIPKPLHGPGCQPRTIFGPTSWDIMRKRTYYEAGYKCEICGVDPPKGQLHAHELYTIDYEKGTSRFERAIAICKKCHDGIHSGRLITMYKKGNPLYSKKYLLDVVENCFKLVHDYNKGHGTDLRVFDTYINYLKVPSIASEIEALMKKYNMRFYTPAESDVKWGDWKLLVGDREYATPYASYEEWENAMAKLDSTDKLRNAKDPFSGGVFDSLDEIFGLTEQ